MQTNIESQQKQHELELTLVEEDTDREIEQVKQQLAKKLDEERRTRQTWSAKAIAADNTLEEWKNSQVAFRSTISKVL